MERTPTHSAAGCVSIPVTTHNISFSIACTCCRWPWRHWGRRHSCGSAAGCEGHILPARRLPPPVHQPQRFAQCSSLGQSTHKHSQHATGIGTISIIPTHEQRRRCHTQRGTASAGTEQRLPVRPCTAATPGPCRHTSFTATTCICRWIYAFDALHADGPADARPPRSRDCKQRA